MTRWKRTNYGKSLLQLILMPALLYENDKDNIKDHMLWKDTIVDKNVKAPQAWKADENDDQLYFLLKVYIYHIFQIEPDSVTFPRTLLTENKRTF